MKLLLISAMLFLLTACGGGGTPAVRESSNTTPSAIHKGAVFEGSYGETTPVLFNGELLYVKLTPTNGAPWIKIFRQSDKAVLFNQFKDLELISAFVKDDTLYIYGATNNRTEIGFISTKDLTTWTALKVAFSAPTGTNVFNTSVAPAVDGFVMAYEICRDGTVCFNVRFAKSKDLETWEKFGPIFGEGYYTACPTIRYLDGYYYVFYLSNYPSATDPNGYYSTNVSRSKDLITWEQSKRVVLSPLDGGDKYNNASDIDFVEVNGQLRIVYLNVSQWFPTGGDVGLREAVFDGTFAEFVKLFF
jgi:predicted GH43/DUF377 family glycosyl hydrolase